MTRLRKRKRRPAERSTITDDVDEAVFSNSSSSSDNDLVRIDFLGKMVNKNGAPTWTTSHTCTTKVRARIEAELMAMSKAVAAGIQAPSSEPASPRQETDERVVMKGFSPRVGMLSRRYMYR